MKYNKGFTVIEIVVVTVIVMVLLNVLNLTLQEFLIHRQLEMSAIEMVGVINYAYNKTINDNKIYGVKFGRDKYQIVRLEPLYSTYGNSGFTFHPVLEDNEKEDPMGKIFALPQNIKVRNANFRGRGGDADFKNIDGFFEEGYLVIYPDGTAENTMIWLISKNEEVYTIVVGENKGHSKFYNEDIQMTEEPGYIGSIKSVFAELGPDEDIIFYQQTDEWNDSTTFKVSFFLKTPYLQMQYKAGKGHRTNCHLHMALMDDSLNPTSDEVVNQNFDPAKGGFIGYFFAPGLIMDHPKNASSWTESAVNSWSGTVLAPTGVTLYSGELHEFLPSEESPWIDLSSYIKRFSGNKTKFKLYISSYHYAVEDDVDNDIKKGDHLPGGKFQMGLKLMGNPGSSWFSKGVDPLPVREEPDPDGRW